MTFIKIQMLNFIAPLLFSFNAFALEALTPFGTLNLPPHPAHLNLNAPKGGQLTTGVLGSFDSLNPFIALGVAAPNLRMHQFESLLMRRHDAPFALVPQIAKSFHLEDKRLTFTLDEKARFFDNSPITPQDIVQIWQVLKEKGRPNFRQYYGQVKEVTFTPNEVTFLLPDDFDPELPLLLALMPIFKAKAEGFGENRLTPMMGSGPYHPSEIKVGESVTFSKNPNWWGRDLPQNQGLHHLEKYKYDFYRDSTALLEAFRKGAVDWRFENDPAKWREIKTWPMIARQEVALSVPLPFKAWFFNTRRENLRDSRARTALMQLFNPEWVNEQLYFGMMQPLSSLFEGSELQSVRATPALTNRARLGKALEGFAQAGFTLENGKLLDVKKQVFSFEILVQSKEAERLALAYVGLVQKAGINASVRLVDSAQYEARLRAFDFDIIEHTLTNSLSPGAEQAYYWHSKAAETQGTRNYAGLATPQIDKTLAQLMAAKSREALVVAAQELDKETLAMQALLPLFAAPKQWLAFKRGVKMPENTSLFGYLPESFWRE
jgi:peptide/nickel transport system substrate-binding protein